MNYYAIYTINKHQIKPVFQDIVPGKNPVEANKRKNFILPNKCENKQFVIFLGRGTSTTFFKKPF